MRRIITILSLILIVNLAKGQERAIYHSYSPTASSWDIVEWNIQDTSKVPWVLKETIDNQGRVIQLEFLKNGELIGDYLCYLANRVTFEYKPDRIIETLFQDDQELLATDCEMYYKNIYFLDRDGFINKVESIAKYDFSQIDSTEIAQWKGWVPEKVVRTDSVGINLQVDYFYHSFAKMSGKYPVNRNYELIDDYYYGDEPEKASIKKGLEKTKN